MKRKMVVREVWIEPKWLLRHPENDGKTASRIRTDRTVVECSGGPVDHKFFDDIALQRWVDEPAQEPDRNGFKLAVRGSNGGSP